MVLQGAVESICVGEIKLSLRKSLVKLGCSFISRDPKLQFLISDLEIVMRPQEKRTKKSTSKKPRSSGRGKWMIVTNVARFLSVSVMELVVKVGVLQLMHNCGFSLSQPSSLVLVNLFLLLTDG